MTFLLQYLDLFLQMSDSQDTEEVPKEGDEESDDSEEVGRT